MTRLTTFRALPYRGCFQRRRDDRYDLLDFFNNCFAVSIGKVPTGFFTEVIDRSDEVLVGSVADLAEDLICHNIRTTKLSDKGHAVVLLADHSPPVTEPPAKFVIVLIWNVILYL
jgi:hypothetical protein